MAQVNIHLHKKRAEAATSLVRGYRFNRQTVLLAGGLVSAFGFVLLLAHAAGTFVAAEAESGSRIGPVSVVGDTTASGGSAIVFNAPAATPPPPTPSPPAGIASCQTLESDEACWRANTGVQKPDGSRWTEAQILAGQANGQLGAPLNGFQLITTSGTQANPYVYENKWINDGCLIIRADHVLIRNVYIRKINGNGQCKANEQVGEGMLATSNGDGGVPAPDDVRVVNVETNAGEHSGGIGPAGHGFHFDQANMHGGFVVTGFGSNTSYVNSYIHDVSDIHQACYYSNSCVAGTGNNEDYHRTAMWLQNSSNIYIKHVFVTIWSRTSHPFPGQTCMAPQANPCGFPGGSSGGIELNWNPAWWPPNHGNVLDDVYVDGANNYGIGGANCTSPPNSASCYDSSMSNITARIDGYGPYSDPTNEYSDYKPGQQWTPQFTTYGMPIISGGSYCYRLYKSTGGSNRTLDRC